MPRVKVCGITCLEDAAAAVDAGADALGFVFAPSPRRISPERAREIISRLPPLVITVGVFVDEHMSSIERVRESCSLTMVQLHGNECEETVRSLGRGVIKAVRLGGNNDFRWDEYPAATLLLDTYVPGSQGGTGRSFDWSLAVEVAGKRPIVLAGGLTPENVSQAVEEVQPYAVDVSTGVEREPGRKDYEKIKRFISAAKGQGRGPR